MPFLDEADTLIASPALLARRPLRQPADIGGHTLLDSETRPGDWADWLERAGVPHWAEQRRRTYDHFFVTLQAVADGLGLGIGPLPVLRGDLETGRLVTPFPDILVPRTGYVALIPFDANKSPALTNFVAWLVSEGTDPQGGAPPRSRGYDGAPERAETDGAEADRAAAAAGRRRLHAVEEDSGRQGSAPKEQAEGA